MAACGTCGAENSENARFCSRCGTVIARPRTVTKLHDPTRTVIDSAPPVHHDSQPTEALESGVPSTEDFPTSPGLKNQGIQTPRPASYIPSLVGDDEGDADEGADMTRKATREELFAKAGMTPEQVAKNIAGIPPKKAPGMGLPSAVVAGSEPNEATARARVSDLAKGLNRPQTGAQEKVKSPLASTVSSPEVAAVASSIAAAAAAAAAGKGLSGPTAPKPRPVHTVMGMGAVLPQSPSQPPPAPTPPAPATALAAPPPAPGPSPGGRDPKQQSTILGVAMPGIAPTGAPLRPGAPGNATQIGVPSPISMHPAPAPTPSQSPGPGPAPSGPARLPSAQPTMLGVSAPPGPYGAGVSGHPGILNVPAGPGGHYATTSMPVPSLVPAPAPYIDESLPAPPVIAKKTGVPLALLIPAALGIVLVVGVAAFFLFRGSTPLVATASIDESGADVLALKCVSCPDGTKLSVGSSEALVKANAATLPTHLDVGPNNLKVHIDRPGSGRDEDAKLVVPVAYRLRTEPDAIAQYPAKFAVRIEAAPKVEVSLEGSPVALTDGKATYEIPFGETAHGANETVTSFDRDLTYKVKLPDGRTEEGKLPLKAKIVPLRIDTPRSGSLQTGNTVWVSGQSSPGAKLTVNGATVGLDTRGFFEVELPRPTSSPWKIEVRSSRKDAATRGAEVTVDVAADGARADWLKAFEGQAKLSYAELSSDPGSRAGQRIVLTGELVDTRLVGRQTVSLLEPKDCAGKGSCLVRVLSDRPAPPKGKKTRVWGIVAPKPLTDGGKVIPEVDAAFVDKAP